MNWRTVPTVPTSLALPEVFLQRVHPGVRVLDIGCGEAGIGALIQEAGGVYTGLDVNWPSLERAAKRHRVARGAGGLLPFKAASFDLVLLRAVLTVLVDPAERLAVVREALRVCRGVVGIQDFLLTPDVPLYRARYAEGFSLSGQSGTFPVRQEGSGEVLYWAKHFSLEELDELIREAGGRVGAVSEAPAPTRSGNIINGVTLLAHPKEHLPGAGA
jgi:SAM-dependent methyltransferase